MPFGSSKKPGNSWPPKHGPSPRLRLEMDGPTPTFESGGCGRRGSAPVVPAKIRDPYRDALDPAKNPLGAPPDSQFVRDYNGYKNADAFAKQQERAYFDHLKTAPKTTKKQRNANPGFFLGDPPAPREFHQEAEQHADRAERAFKTAARTREGHGHNFIGYDQPFSASGHRQRTSDLKITASKFNKRKANHSGSQGY